MKSGKEAGPSEIVVEMIKAAGEHVLIIMQDLVNKVGGKLHCLFVQG